MNDDALPVCKECREPLAAGEDWHHDACAPEALSKTEHDLREFEQFVHARNGGSAMDAAKQTRLAFWVLSDDCPDEVSGMPIDMVRAVWDAAWMAAVEHMVRNAKL